MKIAVLDDWQNLARSLADWTELGRRASVDFFQHGFADQEAAAEALLPYDILLTMRERTAFPASLVNRLFNLKMLGLTGTRAPAIDVQALMAKGVTVCFTEPSKTGAGTAELALGLMLAAARSICAGDAAIRAGRFQDGVAPGFALLGKTVGIVGLGRLGKMLARYCRALDMRVLAWSQNLTPEAARAEGATFVSKDELIATADVISLHLVGSERTQGIIGRAEFARMKPGVIFVNTSRASLVDQQALEQAVREKRIVAALDVFEREPLSMNDPLRKAPNTVLTPHLGFATLETLKQFYEQSVENALAYLAGNPIRVITRPSSGH
jgi:phosphoglycerate dehydrogenase-like enzyme